MKLLIVITAALITACAASKKADIDQPPVTETWQGTMQEIAGVMNTFAPIIFSESEFNDPDNFARIDRETEKLAKLALKIKGLHEKDFKNVDSDPSMKLIVSSFSKEMATALDGLRNKQRDFSRSVLRNATSLCVQCHSRGTFGPEFHQWRDVNDYSTLTRIEKAELLSATRQYDRALSIYMSVIEDPLLAKGKPFEWEKALRRALAISLRVKQDFERSNSILDLAIKTSEGPASVKARALEWKRVISEWKSQGTKGSGSGLVMARQLIRQANRHSTLLEEQMSYVTFLRASGLLHDYIRGKNSRQNEAEAYNLLGQCYESVQEDRFWNLNEVYFKACIFKAPHTKIAMDCYNRYEDSLYVKSLRSESRSGSLPSELDYLEYLRILAHSKGG
ncbi:MAG: hypothetical protein IT289_12395 [Oligoflexia bacterium]|nr:hypothetical protein [Oligoflexia bacterium]